MKTVVLATLSFAIFMAGSALVIPLVILFSQNPRRPDVAGDLLMAAYLIAVSSSLCTLGFLVSTAASARWRGLNVTRAVAIAGTLGLIAPIASLFIMALSAGALLPLFRSVPWIAAGLSYGLPGVVLGMAALLIARALPAARPRLD